jgi:hypothetical protein
MPMESLVDSPSRPTVRPIAVTILGWVFVVFSSFSVASSAFGLVFMHFMSRAVPNGEFPPKAKDFPPGFSMLSWMFEYFNALLVAQVALAVFSIFAAVQFLKLRYWSRTYFEALNWVALAWTVVFGIFFAASWVGISSGLPPPKPNEAFPPPAVFGAFGVFITIFVVIFNGAFPAGIIWLLRSRFVRPAFVRSA